MEMERATVSIGAAARLTGINANTLRMWERRYQLGATRRSSGGQRVYSSTDIDHLKLIKKLIDRGLRIGDIAQLSTKTLMELLLDSGGPGFEEEPVQAMLRTQVVGSDLCHYFRTHLKRYPRLIIHFDESDAHTWLTNKQVNNKDLLILQQHSLNAKHLAHLVQISKHKVHVIVLYLYAQQSHLNTLQNHGVTLLRGKLNPLSIDEAVNKVLRFVARVSVLEQSSKTFNITLPRSQPRQFDDQALSETERQFADKLHCKCPQHLTELIRQLNAFEEYSQSCSADNWKQATVHACIYSYANQARHLIEKALLAVLDE